MKSGTLFPIGILLFGFFESCRDHVWSKANWLYAITAPHPYEDALTTLVSGWFRKTLFKKAQLLPVHYYIAKLIPLFTSQIHTQQLLRKKALTGLVSELNVLMIPTCNSSRLGCGSVFLGPAAPLFVMPYQFHLLLIHGSDAQGDQAASVSWDAPSEASTCFTPWRIIVHNPLFGHYGGIKISLHVITFLLFLRGTTNEKLPAAVEITGPANSWCLSVLNKLYKITHKSEFNKGKHLTY